MDAGKRRYILIQLPVEVRGLDAKLSDMTIRRLKHVGNNSDVSSVDSGFRLYRLDKSNLRRWSSSDDLEADLLNAADNLLPGRTEDDLLVELLLKRGIDLVEPVQTRTLLDHTVHAFGGGVLVVYLGEVSVADADTLADGIAGWLTELDPTSPATIFFRDSGFFNDVAKANVEAILRQRLKDRGPGQPDLLDQVRSV